MSEKLFNKKVIENAVCDFLPNEVLFALGDKDRVECAAIWINKLQAENKILNDLCASHEKRILTDSDKIRDIQAENAKLREGLETISGHMSRPNWSSRIADKYLKLASDKCPSGE